MGLFSSKTKVTVATTVTRVIEDNLLPDSPVTGTVKALRNLGDIPEYTMEELIQSIGLKADRMYTYADTKYEHGLPSGEFYTANQGEEAVKAVLDKIHGKSVLIDYCRYGPPNTLHIGWMKLISSYGYDPATNQLGTLSASKGTPVYLKDMVVALPGSLADTLEPGALDQWGTPPKAGAKPASIQIDSLALAGLVTHTPVQIDNAITQEELRVSYMWEAQVKVGTIKVGGVDTPIYEAQIKEESLVIKVTGYDNAKDYFHAKYLVNGQVRYWIYEVGSGTHPTLDEYFGKPPEENGAFFPFVYFRYNKVAENTDKTSAAYQTSKRLLKYLDMDFDDVTDAINENPDIGDVAQAMMIMAVPANTTNAAEQRYLFDFFDRWYAGTDKFINEQQADAMALINNDPENAKNSLIIQDKRFKMALSNNGIFRSYKAGTIGKVGSHASGFESTVRTETYTSYGFEGEEITQTYEFPVKYHYYRKQVLPGLYLELKVVDLRVLYYVDEAYAVTADDEDDILLIPLDRSITDDYKLLERENLYARSLHYVFNSLIVTKIKWYQQGWFKAFLTLVAIVATIFTGPGGALLSAIINGAGTAAITAALMAFVTELIIGLVITVVLKFFVKAVGIKAAFIIAVVAAVSGAYQMIQAGSIKGAPWAMELVQLANGLVKAATESLGEMFKDLQEEFLAFGEFAKEQNELLESTQKLLDGSIHLSPMVLFGETPDEFFNRTVHSGNIGTVSIDAVSEFVNNALRLPKLHETAGDVL